MSAPQPSELIEFLNLLTENAPDEYEPWLFRCEAGSKAPDLSHGSWKDESARLGKAEAVKWMEGGGNVGIAGRPDDPLINVDIDDEDETTPDDLKDTLIARSRSRTGVHAWYFEAPEADIPNIPIEEAGEVRANWQYVVAPGSYVETDPEDVPRDERDLAGYYTVEAAEPVTSLRLDELPEVFRQHTNPDPDAEDIEAPDMSEFQGDDSGSDARSGLFDISARDVVRKEGGGSTDPGDRWAALFHDSETDKNMSLSQRGQLHCWRHEVAHNGLQALVVLSDYDGGCRRVGAGHNRSGAGKSCLHHEDGAHIWPAWKYAKENGYIPEDDPIPYSALKHICRQRGICPESEIPAEYDPDSDGGRLPEYAYNAAIESIEGHDGLNPGRQRTDETENTGTPDTEELAGRDTTEDGESETDSEGDGEGDTPPEWGQIYQAYRNADGDETDMPRYHATMRLLEESHWRTLKETDDVYHYDSEAGIFRGHGDKVLRQRLGKQLKEQYSGHERREVLEHLYSHTTVPQEELGGDDWHICAKNCVIKLSGAGQVTRKDHSPEYDFLGRVQTEYDPDAECPRFRQFLDESVRSGSDKKKLQEYAGYALMHWALPHHKSLFLVGPTASGKSTFLDTIRTMLGDDSVASLTPQQMTAERFGGAELFGAWANIRNDIPNELIENTGEFKELIAGDPVKAEKKYQDPFTFEPKAKHMFSANELPEASTDDRAFYRRILLVAFPHETPRPERDHRLDDKLQDEHPGVLNWCLNGLQRLLEQGGFTGDRDPWQTEETWEKWSDSAKRFYQSCLDEDPDDDLATADVWQAYLAYCDSEGIPAKSRQAALTKALKKQGIETGRFYDNGSRRRALLNVTWTGRGEELFQASQESDGTADETDPTSLGGYEQ